MCYECVINVLWMCYDCVMKVLWKCCESVVKVLWKCCESVMKVLWKCYESVMKVLWKWYESVMDVLWMCYGCVMDVLWMHWGLSGMCYGCMRDGWMMGILYLLCKLYCKWYCVCDIVVVCDITDVNLCILFFRAFYMTIKYSTPRRCMCVISRHIEPATWSYRKCNICTVSVSVLSRDI